MKQHTLLIDGNSVAYTINISNCKNAKDFSRQYFARIREYAKQFTTLVKCIIFFDDKRGNFREALYPNYQKGRKDARLKYTEVQKEESKKRSEYLKYLKELIDKSPRFNYLHYSCTETDDLLALYVNNIQKEDEIVTILTTDKDLFQLIRSTGNKKVQVLFLIKRKLIKDESVGKQALDKKIWLGDNSDSIPGVCKNVGEKNYEDFRTFIEKMNETHTDPTDKEKAKRVSESLNIKYIPSFSNFNQEQLDLNRKLIDLNYVIKLDKNNGNEKTEYLKNNIDKAKISPYSLYNI